MTAMNNRNKKHAKAKEPVRLRFKALTNGNKSIYLDCYNNGKREYEFLKLYLVPELTPIDKDTNKETLQLANAIKSKRIIELQNGAHGFSSGTTKSKANLVEYVQMLADKHREFPDGRENSTYQSYMTLLYHLRLYGGDRTMFKQVDKDYCAGFIEYLKTAKSALSGEPLSENTKATYMKRLDIVINNAIYDGITAINPFRQIRPEEKPQRKEANVCYLTVDEVRAMAETPCCSTTIKNGFMFSCFTGLRYSDIKALTWEKLQSDGNGNTFIDFIQKKTGKQEYLPVSREAMRYLPERGTAGDGDTVFDMPNGNYVNLLLKQWVFTAGITKKVTFHVARHTNATLLLSLGVPIETVSKLLGHSDIQTTQIYAKVMDKNKREAVDKLDGVMD
jgi:integrase